MKIRKRNAITFLFVGMLLFAGIPYLFYATALAKMGNLNAGGSLAMLGSVGVEVKVGKIAVYFVYIKDLLAVILLIALIPNIKKKVLVYMNSVIALGFTALLLSGKFNSIYLVAAIRTYIFMLDTIFYWISYPPNIETIKKVTRCIEMILVIQFLVVLRQIVINGNIGNFGAGAMRYSGAFSGSGNLGCFTIGTVLWIYLVSLNCEFIKTIERNIVLLVSVILAIASGTRTAMVIVIFLSAYIFISTYAKKKGISKNIVIVGYLLAIASGGISIMNWIVNRVGRGEMMVSGSGRLRVLQNLFENSSILELLIGHGIGYATNASITLGAQDSIIADATINLILAQFGMVGLVVFGVGWIYIFYLLFKRSKKSKELVFMLLIIFGLMCMVGNLFEQIAMSIIYFSIVIILEIGIIDSTYIIHELDNIEGNYENSNFRR